MTGTGSGYIGNGCVLNPFAGITLLYLHDSFPFIEAYSVPHCTPANQPEIGKAGRSGSGIRIGKAAAYGWRNRDLRWKKSDCFCKDRTFC